jgi:hypothetical protein
MTENQKSIPIMVKKKKKIFKNKCIEINYFSLK